MPLARDITLSLVLLSAACTKWVPNAGPDSPSADTDARQPWPLLDDTEAGLGWLIRDGVFEGLHEQLRVRAEPGWDLLTAEELTGVTDSSQIGLRDRDTEVTVIFEREWIRDGTLADHLVRRQDVIWATLGLVEVETAPSSSARFIAAPIELARGRTEGLVRPVEYLLGAHELDVGHIEILAWYHADLDPELVQTRVDAALASVDLLTSAELDLLRTTLARLPDPRDAISDEWSLRGGVYRNYTLQLTWSDPSGMWMIQPNHPEEDVVLAIEDPNHVGGLFSIDDLSGVADIDATAWHEGILDTVTFADAQFERERQRVSVGAVEALVDMLRLEYDGSPKLFWLASVKHGELAATWMLSGDEYRARANLQRLDRVIAQLRAGVDDKPVIESEGRYVDNLAGWALRPPPGVRPEQIARPGLGRWSRALRWASGAESVTVVTVSWSGNPIERASMTDALGRHVERDAGLSNQPATQERALELGGRPGYQRSYVRAQTRDDIVLIDRGSTLYALHVHASDPALFEATLASFELLD